MGAAADAGRAARPPRTKDEWFRELLAAGVPCAPINTIDGGVALAEELGLDPVVTVGGVPGVRNPITFSDTPARYELPPPGLGRTRRGDPRMAEELRFPTGLGTSDASTISLLGQDLAEDLMGKVGFGELAFWLVAGRRPAAGEVRLFEAVLVRWPITASRPTAIAARLTYLSAPDSLQGALAAGLLGGGSRFLGVTEDCGQFLADTLAAAGRDEPDYDVIALAAVQRARDGRRFIPGLGHPVHKEQDPRTPVLIRIAERGGPARAAPAAVRGDRPGPPAGAGQDGCR